MRIACLHLLATMLLLASALSQVSPTSPSANRTTPAPPAQVQPVAASVLSALPQFQEIAASSRADLARLRVDRWKMDSTSRRQAQTDADSLQRNLSEALPELIALMQANPQSLAAAFKLYRNLNALHDVMASLAETAGAFGTQDDFQSLSTDSSNLDRLRRALAEDLEQATITADAAIVHLQTQVQQTAAASAPVQKIVVDDTRPCTPAKAGKKQAASKPQPQTQQQ